MGRKKNIKKGDTLVGPGALITVLHIEGDTIMIQNNVMHTISKVPRKSIEHLEIHRIKND